MYKHYCELDGGTTVYKSPAKWALENPSLVGKLPAWKIGSDRNQRALPNHRLLRGHYDGTIMVDPSLFEPGMNPRLRAFPKRPGYRQLV